MDITRRTMLGYGTLMLAPGISGATSVSRSIAARTSGGESRAAALRFATLTDVHYADADIRGNRHYRDSIAKVRAAVDAINGGESPVAFAATLGDLIDSRNTPIDEGGVEQEVAYLRTIEAELERLSCERHYVFGNHCVHTLTKDEFAEHSGAQPSFYSFDRPFTEGSGSLHVVVLDACFTSDGTPYGRRNFHWTDANIPEHELRWLEADLAATRSPTVVLTHQRLDGEGSTTIKNAPEVRAVLERSERVLAVLQGHHHENTLEEIEGIPYVVLRAVVEGPQAAHNAFGLVDVHADLSIVVHGFGDQASHELAT